MTRRLITAAIVSLSVTSGCSNCPIDSHGTFGFNVAESVIVNCNDFYATNHRWPFTAEIKDTLAQTVRGYPDVRFEQVTLEPLQNGDLRVSYIASTEHRCLSSRETLTVSASPPTQPRILGKPE